MMNDKVTCEDMDRYAQEYALKQNQQAKFEGLLLAKTKQELEYRKQVIDGFKYFDVKYLTEILDKALDEIERLARG